MLDTTPQLFILSHNGESIELLSRSHVHSLGKVSPGNLCRHTSSSNSHSVINIIGCMCCLQESKLHITWALWKGATLCREGGTAMIHIRFRSCKRRESSYLYLTQRCPAVQARVRKGPRWETGGWRDHAAWWLFNGNVQCQGKGRYIVFFKEIEAVIWAWKSNI